MKRTRIAALALLLAGFIGLTQAGDWPQFRGPAGSGVTDESQVPAEWAKDKNVRWKVAIPGVAWSSPVVWGERVFVTTAITDNQKKPRPFDYGGFAKKDFNFKDGRFPKGDFKGFPKGGFGSQKPPDAVYHWKVLCLDRDTGKVLWEKTARQGKPTIPTQASNTYASETPITDGERLYAYFGMHGIFCYDLNGHELWSKDLGSYPMQFGFGTGSSPALADGKVFIQCDNEQKSFLAALDAKTGNELWRVDRPGRSSWSTPFIWKTKERTEVVCCGQQKVMSYDLQGKALWEMGKIGGSFNASPAANAERIYFGNSGPMTGGQLFAVKAGALGDITLKDGEKSNAGVAWMRSNAGPGTASPLVYEGYVYVPERGALSCYHAKTGEPAYQKERLQGARGFTASPWAAGGKVYLLDEDGTTFVIKAGKEFELLATNKLGGEMFWATPAVSGGMLFVRGVDHLYCIKQ
jgi:outer membrane protein assembly factor BamB